MAESLNQGSGSPATEEVLKGTPPAAKNAPTQPPAGFRPGTLVLAWQDLSYSIADKKAKDEGGRKVILQPQNGRALPGGLLALMGPSGSGKTSLLNAIAGRLPVTKGAVFSGSVTVNDVRKQDLPCHFADLSAYVEQEDCLYALSTVGETCDFAARLRLPSRTPAEERTRRIDGVLRTLGLAHVKDTLVGGSMTYGDTRGLSGGERKRLSIAIELLHDPRALFLDEPTTGLDSYQALNVMEKLRDISQEGCTVLVSIHQPRSSIFAMLSSVCLLSKGSPVYTGPAEDVTEYFGKLGHALPEKFNPADFIIDLVSVDQRDPDALRASEERRSALISAWERQSGVAGRSSGWRESADDDAEKTKMNSILQAKPELPAGQNAFCTPFSLLLRRGWREQMRDRAAVAFKVFFQMLFTAIFGLVYLRLGRSQDNIQDRMMLLTFLTMNVAFGASIGTAQVIPRQLGVVSRERANRLYSIFPFYLSCLLVTIPQEIFPTLLNNLILFNMCNLGGSFLIFFVIMFLENLAFVSIGMVLSAIIPGVTMAAQIAPAVVIIFLIFNGNFVNVDSVPVYFVWLKEISPIQYAFTAAASNEFDGASFECAASDPICVTSGEQVLDRLNFDEDDLILKGILALTGLSVAINILAFLVLLLRRPRFLQLQAPMHPPAAETTEQSKMGA